MCNFLHSCKANIIALILFVIAFALPTTGAAQTYTAVASGSWNSSSTWGVSIPSQLVNAEEVFIPEGIVVTLNNDLLINNPLARIVVEGTLKSSVTATITLANGQLFGPGEIDVSNIVLRAGGRLTGDNVTVDALTVDVENGDSAFVAGSLVINQTFDRRDGTLVLNGADVTVNGIMTGYTQLASDANTALRFYGKGSQSALVFENERDTLKTLVVDIGVGNELPLQSWALVNESLDLRSGTLNIEGATLSLYGPFDCRGTLKANESSGLGLFMKSGIPKTFNLIAQSIGSFVVSIPHDSVLLLQKDLVVSNSMSLTDGIVYLNGHNLTMRGYVSANKGRLHSTSASDVAIISVFDVSLEFMPGGQQVNNFTVDAGDEVWMEGLCSLSSDLFVHGKLTLEDGALLLDSTNITIGENGSVEIKNATTYVTGGSFTRYVASGIAEPTHFPIGSNFSYTPVYITAPAGSPSSMVTVIADDQPRINGNTGASFKSKDFIVHRLWTITPQQEDARMDVKFVWPQDDSKLNDHTRGSLARYDEQLGRWELRMPSAVTALENYESIVGKDLVGGHYMVFDATLADVAEQNRASGLVNAYPSPFADVLNIDCRNERLPLEIRVIDISGRVVEKYSPSSPLQQISSTGWAPGVYTVVSFDGETTHAQKIIKR